jgi:hypothetical protein
LSEGSDRTEIFLGDVLIVEVQILTKVVSKWLAEAKVVVLITSAMRPLKGSIIPLVGG